MLTSECIATINDIRLVGVMMDLFRDKIAIVQEGQAYSVYVILKDEVDVKAFAQEFHLVRKGASSMLDRFGSVSKPITVLNG